MPKSSKLQLNLLMEPAAYHEFRDTAIGLGYTNRYAAFLVNVVMPVFALDLREVQRRVRAAFSANPDIFKSDEAKFFAGQLAKMFQRIHEGQSPFGENGQP